MAFPHLLQTASRGRILVLEMTPDEAAYLIDLIDTDQGENAGAVHASALRDNLSALCAKGGV